MVSKILVRVTNGSKIYIENVTHLLQDGVTTDWYREIKIKETQLENYKDHLIYTWAEGFYESPNLPDWISTSPLLEFELMIEGY